MNPYEGQSLHHAKGIKEGDPRHNLVFQAADEQDRDFRDQRKYFFARPVLMAKARNVLSGWNNTTSRSVLPAFVIIGRFLRWYHIPYRCESILQYQTYNVSSFLIFGDQLDGDCSAKTLTKNNDFTAVGLLLLADIIKCCLRIDVDTFFVGIASGQAIASILQHQDIATDVFF